MGEHSSFRRAESWIRRLIFYFPAAILWLVSCAPSTKAGTDSTNGISTNAWFPPVGEELVYRIYWGAIPIGKTAIITRWTEEDGRKLLAIRYRARSNKVLALIYPTDDSAETLIDPLTFLPIRFTLNLKEGRHRNYEVTTFDYQHLKATWRSLLKNQKKEFPIEADTRDLISFLYFMRQKHLEPEQNVHYRVMADEKLYDLWLGVRKYEKVKLPGFGEVDSLRIDPSAAFNGLFVRTGKMGVWVTNDRRNVFTKIEASLPVANVRALLSEVRGPQDDIWTQTTKKLIAEGRIEKDDPDVEKTLKELEAPVAAKP
jgi:hypothetical protein